MFLIKILNKIEYKTGNTGFGKINPCKRQYNVSNKIHDLRYQFDNKNKQTWSKIMDFIFI